MGSKKRTRTYVRGKHTRNFRVDIKEQYQLGEVSSNAKSSPAKILKYLQKNIPKNCACLPKVTNEQK